MPDFQGGTDLSTKRKRNKIISVSRSRAVHSGDRCNMRDGSVEQCDWWGHEFQAVPGNSGETGSGLFRLFVS